MTEPVNKETALMMMQLAVDDLRYTAPAMRDYQKVASELEFNYYKELVRAGFKEEQAIKIIQAHGFTPRTDGGSE